MATDTLRKRGANPSSREALPKAESEGEVSKVIGDDRSAKISGVGYTVQSRKEISLAISWRRFLQLYTKFVVTSLNQDKLIKTLQYTLWMLSRFYYGKDDLLAREALAKLSGELSRARYVTRLLALPTALEAVQTGNWAIPTSLEKAMAWIMVIYYPLENFSYLKSQAPQWIQFPKMSPRLQGQQDLTATKATTWSCRFRLAYIVLDVVRSTLILRPSQLSNTSSTTVVLPSIDTRRHERLQMIRNALFFMPAIHSSLPNWDTPPWLSVTVRNSLLWLEAVICMYQSYRNLPTLPDETS